MSGLDELEAERGLSVEMKLRKHVKSLIVSNVGMEQVLFEGNLGRIQGISMLDHSVLEVRGVNGVLRVDLILEELEEMIRGVRFKESSGSRLGSVKSTNILEMKKNE